MDLDRIRADFDEIASFAEPGAAGSDRYDPFLLSLVPPDATPVLDVGCGHGRLTVSLATRDRDVVGIDLSPAMIARAGKAAGSARVSFTCGDFLALDLPLAAFGCVVSAAALHHMPAEAAVARMAGLLRSGGRLIVHDLRRDANVADTCRAAVALIHELTGRFVRTGWPISSMKLRRAWRRHGEGETYLSLAEASARATRVLPGARVVNHWLWRYTIVWDKPAG